MARCGVSRPRNHLTSSNGTPTETEYSPSLAFSTREVHQNVPEGVSVYWYQGLKRSATSNTVRAVQFRQTVVPSTAPRASDGKRTRSFS